MRVMRSLHAFAGFFLLVTAQAVWGEAVLKDVEINHDPATLRRGAETVTSVCMSCHSLKYLRYRDLLDVGFSRAEVEAMSMGNKMGDPLLAMTPADIAQQSYGRVPPDLSLMAKARTGGAAYIYSLLTGYYQDAAGQVDNHVFPGTAMPDMLGWSSADTQQRIEIETQSREAAAFLQWAADPRAAERKGLGYYVVGYLIVLTVLLYLVKRRVWARLH